MGLRGANGDKTRLRENGGGVESWFDSPTNKYSKYYDDQSQFHICRNTESR